MSFWSDAVLARAADGVFRAALLAELQFGEADPADTRFWAGGFGLLKTADDRVWKGVGAMATVEGLAQPIGTTAPAVTFTLSGVDARVVALARSQSGLVKGRDCTVYIQAFGDDFSELLDFRTVWTGIMDRMTYSSLGAGVFSVRLTAESVWTGRSKPPYGEYTDTDQQARYPGDTGLEFVSTLEKKTIWYP